MTTPRRRPLYLTVAERHQDRWVFSYTDVVTILLVLFIAVAAKAAHERKLPGILAASPVIPSSAPTSSLVANTAPANTTATTLEPKSPATSESLLRMRDLLQQQGIEQRLEDEGLVISLPQAIMFPSGEDRLSPEARGVIEQIAKIIRDVPNKIQLVGHADAVPIHNQRFHNNWELSAARGFQILEVLTKDFGISESRLAVVGYGSQNPLNSNETQDGRAANRRVEIVIVEQPPAIDAPSKSLF